MPTVLIARRNSHSEAWRSCIRKLALYESQHCLCRYGHSAHRVHFRVYTSGIATKGVSCREADVSLQLSRSELD
eukprot:8522829-Alexandrium_andersonii.AAC.1